MTPQFTPLHFGSLSKRLFGFFHAPPPTTGRREIGIVLCPAHGHEYIQFHRPLRQLALQLSDAGFSVLRFDFSGCGDSEGDEESWGLESWKNDIDLAIEELKQRAQVTSVGLVGLRLGATLATQVALTREDVHSLVLWDPVTDGPNYLRELRAQHQQMLAYAHVLPSADDQGEEILGFPLPQELAAEVESIDLLAQSDRPAEHICVIESNESADQRPLRDRFSDLGVQVEHHKFSDPSLWAWVEDFGKVHVPRKILDAVGTWVGALPR